MKICDGDTFAIKISCLIVIAGSLCFLLAFLIGRHEHDPIPRRILIHMKSGGTVDADEVEKDFWVESPYYDWEKSSWTPIKFDYSVYHSTPGTLFLYGIDMSGPVKKKITDERH